MNTVFVGGSRHITRLPDVAKDRLGNIINSGARVLVGDANGADKAVQKYFADASYKNLQVFCSGKTYRNNVGQWETRYIEAPKRAKGFQFYAAKDREMALEADYGLMVWDGKSPGTILNILRLVQRGKKAVLIAVPEKKSFNFRSLEDLKTFLARCSEELRNAVFDRATSDERKAIELPSDVSLFNQGSFTLHTSISPIDEKAAEDISVALESGNLKLFIDRLGAIAKTHGMSKVAKDAGLARESLYRSLSVDGNPEFSTVFRVMASIGLKLMVHKEERAMAESR